MQIAKATSSDKNPSLALLNYYEALGIFSTF